MGIREVMEAHPKVSQAAVGLLIAAALTAIAVQVGGSRRGITTKQPDTYFTDDDGKTFFAAGPENIPPFDHNGKQAVAAFVYRADGQDFVAFMARYKPETRAKIIAAKHVAAEDDLYGRELKKPGDKEWAAATDRKRLDVITNVTGPKGQLKVEPIEPDN